MTLYSELLSAELGEYLIERLGEKDFQPAVESKALEVLQEIKNILSNKNPEDFMIVDKIVDVFIKNNIDIKGCHDF